MKASNSDEPGSIERNIEPSGENPPRDDDSSVDMLEAIQSAVDTLHAYSLTHSLTLSLARTPRSSYAHDPPSQVGKKLGWGEKKKNQMLVAQAGGVCGTIHNEAEGVNECGCVCVDYYARALPPPQRHEKIGLEMGMERWGLWGSTLCSFM